MERYREPLLFAVAGVSVYLGARLAFELGALVLDGVALSGAFVYVPCLALLGYAAGQRRSMSGVLALIAGYLGAFALVSFALR